MIDWFGVASAALWIFGLAVLLATASLARAFQEKPTRQVLAQPGFRAAIIGGIIFFALGMLLSAGTWLERVGWLIVAALALWEGATAWRNRNRA